MAFCTNCGKELREGDKFCFYCGEAVRNVEETSTEKEVVKEVVKEEVVKEEVVKEETVKEEVVKEEVVKEEAVKEPEKEAPGHLRSMAFDRKKLPVIIGGAAVVIVIIGAVLFGGRSDHTGVQKESSVTAGSESATEETKYDTYSNDTVHFSADYPQDYTVSEPADNNVVFTEGEDADFQVVIEYAYHTAGDSMIYSAADFHNQISADDAVLTDWLGTDDVQVTEQKQDKIAGRDCYRYGFKLQMDGEEHAGNLYLVDGDGKFGCYTFMSVINEAADSAELYKEQAEAVKESFRITGAHQAEGYTVYSYDDLDMKFAVRDSAMGKTKQSRDEVVVYPVDGVFTEASIWILDAPYKEGKKTVEEILKSGCDYTLTHNENGKYTSQVGTAACGRYDYAGINAEYYANNQKYTMTVFTLVHDGKYWYIRTKYTDDYAEATENALSDILFSLKFGDDPSGAGQTGSKTSGADSKTGVQSGANTNAENSGQDSRVKEVIAEIEGTTGYVVTDAWKPLAAKDDFNGDGVEEFLAVYEVKNGNAIEVRYDVWSLKASGAVKLKSEVLFTEVGGNNGVVGIVESGGKTYLAIYRYEPEGEQFNNYYMYYPWETTKSALADSNIYLECHGSYEQEEKGRYIIGDTKVEKSKFDARYKELTNWAYRLSLIEASTGNGVVTLEEMKNRN